MDHMDYHQDRGGQGGRFTPSSAAQLASLFHGDEDYSSSGSDQERVFSARRGDPPSPRGGSLGSLGSSPSSSPSQASNILSAAAALRGSFHSPPHGRGNNKDGELAETARAYGGRKKTHASPGMRGLGGLPSSANRSPQRSPGTAAGSSIREQHVNPMSSRSSNHNANSGHMYGRRNNNQTRGGGEFNTPQPRLHESSLSPMSSDKDRDVEAARPTTRATSQASSVSASEFEFNKDRDPALWMTVGSTTGIGFLLYTLVSQAACACSSFAFLRSAEEDQLSWKTGCSATSWNPLFVEDEEDDGYHEFNTHVGWKYYGIDEKFSELGDISQTTSVIGSLTGIVHTLIVILSSVFFLFTLSALCLSCPCCAGGKTGGKKDGGKKDGGENDGGENSGNGGGCESDGAPNDGGGGGDKEDVATTPKRLSPLVLGYDCHRWMFLMAGIDVLAGVWFFGLGCVGFYLAVTWDFTDGLEEIFESWGEGVSCSAAATNPRYGFIANGISVILLVGGGIISFARANKSDRELKDAVRDWERDRKRAAEMRARMAMIRKKEEYAAAAAAAARAAVLDSERAGRGGGGATPLQSPSSGAAAAAAAAADLEARANRERADRARAEREFANRLREARAREEEGYTPHDLQSPSPDSPRFEMSNIDLHGESGGSGRDSPLEANPDTPDDSQQRRDG